MAGRILYRARDQPQGEDLQWNWTRRLDDMGMAARELHLPLVVEAYSRPEMHEDSLVLAV